MFMKSTARWKTPLPSGRSSLRDDLLKAAVSECLRIHLIHFFYKEVIVFQEKKPLYMHMTKQYSIADHILTLTMKSCWSCIQVSAFCLQYVRLAFIYLNTRYVAA